MTQRQFEILIDLIYTIARLAFHDWAADTKLTALQIWRKKWFGDEEES